MQFNKYTYTQHGDEDENGDGTEDGIVEGGGETKKRNEPHKNCRRDQALLFRTRHHLCRQGVAFAGTRQLRLQSMGLVHTHHTEIVTGSEGREGGNGVGGGIGVGGGNGDGHGVEGGNGDGDGAGTGTGVEANGGAQNGNEDRSGNKAGMGTETKVDTRGRTQDGNGDRSGDGNESSSGDEKRDENGNGNKDRIGEGGREEKKRKKPHKSCRRHVGKGRDLGGKRKKCRK